MEINYQCPRCQWGQTAEENAIGQTLECDHCHEKIEPGTGSFVSGTQQVERCFVCNGDQFYRQKDFNRKLGLGIIIIAAVTSILTENYLPLGVAVVVDSLIFLFLPLITICYKCKGIYRAFEPNPTHGRFELIVHDKHR